MTNTDKSKKNVSLMFNNIAPKYDFLNHFFSLGIDIIWRKKVRRLIAHNNAKKILKAHKQLLEDSKHSQLFLSLIHISEPTRPY